ncbi:helix-turn-helix domain-containing protein [Vibrio parahaemolyticus]|uniref:helix-turn-helix domain-containing protein n=1 Tax=Vibrio alginolyticus TaxID=663 RepID=UPI0035C73257|nr:helix-turn-helix domain-containing protein [Vibrio parahaemolyticus]
MTKRTQYDLMHPLFDAIAESDLSAPQAHLLLTIFKFANGQGVAYPSYEQLRKYTKMSQATVAKHIKSLTESGWIKYTKGSGHAGLNNEYQINIERVLGCQEDNTNVVTLPTALPEDTPIDVRFMPKDVAARLRK